MFKQFFEVFWPKLKEYVAEQGLNNAMNIKDFEHTLENLQENLKLLSVKAVDVETEIKNAEDSGRKKRKREVEVWLEGVKSIEKQVYELGSEAESKGFMMRFLDGGKAAQLSGDIDKLVQQRLGIGEPVLDACGSQGETLLTDEIVGGAFTQNLESVLKILDTRQVSRIGVYGMGGVGKTTLARHIYNRLVQEYGGRVVWVTVSHEFTLKSLQDKIAHFMGVKLDEEAEEAFRARRLNSFLSDKKISVLILDDVWRNIDMREVGCELEGCRLIITSRSANVCCQIGCQKRILVGKLGKDESWKLFNETLGNVILVGSQVEDIAKSVAEVCDGLPLGIIVLAGGMKSFTTVYEWRNALADLKGCVDDGQDDPGEVGEVFKVLKYSFDRLKKRNDERESDEFNRLQLCFRYCSLYPEDWKIHRDLLVGRFISEGMLDGKRSRRARVDQGRSILDELVDVCLLESCGNAGDRVKMHDLVRTMALRIPKGKYLVRAGDYSLTEIPGQQEWTKDLEKVSLMQSGIRRIEEGFSPNCPKLSTLLLPDNRNLKNIPESFFSKMQGLCTLDLSYNSKIAMLPNSVSDLTSLKSLLLECCSKLEKVPYLGKLKALRELDLRDTAIEEVPRGLEKLVKLEFLSLGDANNLTMLPSGFLLKLVCLRHLNTPSHIKAPMEEIQDLKLLEEFIGSVERVEDFNCYIRSGESHRERPTSYTITTGGLRITSFSGYSHYKKILGLFECNLVGKIVLGQGTECLIIEACEGLRSSFLDDFSGLRRLKIVRCGGIEWIFRSDGQASQISTLEFIELYHLDDVKGVVLMERWAVFSALKYLYIRNCKKMRKVGLPASGLPNLEEINIRSCGEIEEIFEEDEGRDPVTTLPKLRELTLADLPRLKRVSKATIISNSIQHIYIIKCPELMKKLPLHFDDDLHPPPSLIRIEVEREWWDSLDWDTHTNPNLPQLLQPFLNFSEEEDIRSR